MADQSDYPVCSEAVNHPTVIDGEGWHDVVQVPAFGAMGTTGAQALDDLSESGEDMIGDYAEDHAEQGEQ